MPPRARIVRRAPLSERIWAAINPLDFLLWLSEEIETRDLDSKSTGVQLGLALNFAFLILRANARPSNSADDVFNDDGGSGWLAYLIQLFLWTCLSLSVGNAAYVFSRTRHYRLFEANVERGPGTPSAQRVRVQSSPAASSPMRMLSDMMVGETAESRAHPDGTRDVWELNIWDPRPVCLHALAYFSPLHVLLYMLELPLDPMDQRPSVTVFKCIFLQACLSTLLQLLLAKNEQKQKDTAIVQKEVLHEYDIKYVHPRLHPVVRDVATQVSMDSADAEHEESVQSGTPTTLIRRGFQTHPNPNYMKHIDPENLGAPPPHQPSNIMSPRLFTPASKSRHSDSFMASHQAAARSRQSLPPAASSPVPPSTATTTSASTNTSLNPNTAGSGFGGSLGAFTHMNSPLKKATSLSDINNEGGFFSPRNSRELAAIEQREAAQRAQRRASPLKEDRSRPATDWRAQSPPVEQSPVPAINPFAKARPHGHRYERFPSRW